MCCSPKSSASSQQSPAMCLFWHNQARYLYSYTPPALLMEGKGVFMLLVLLPWILWSAGGQLSPGIIYSSVREVLNCAQWQKLPNGLFWQLGIARVQRCSNQPGCASDIPPLPYSPHLSPCQENKTGWQRVAMLLLHSRISHFLQENHQVTCYDGFQVALHCRISTKQLEKGLVFSINFRRTVERYKRAIPPGEQCRDGSFMRCSNLFIT